MRKLAALPVFAALALAGCASHPATPVATPTPTTYYGESASAIAALIKGCSDVHANDPGGGSASGLASTASCTLGGRVVDVNSWNDDASADLGPTIRADKVEAYYARGNGWTVTTRDNPLLQLQILNDAGRLMELAGTQMPTQDVRGEKATAKAVVASLGGRVVHVTP